MDEKIKQTLDELRNDIHLKSIVYRNKCKRKKEKLEKEKLVIIKK